MPTDSKFNIDSAMKAVQWELAKGHLRALVEIQGCYDSTSDHDFVTLKDRVEGFINLIEDDGLHE